MKIYFQPDISNIKEKQTRLYLIKNSVEINITFIKIIKYSPKKLKIKICICM